MKRGTIDLEAVPGGLDLAHTLESGQTYHWRRVDGEPYGTRSSGTWYETALDGVAIQVKQEGSQLHWRASEPAEPLVRDLLRLDDDLPYIFETFPDDPALQAARKAFDGMRIVRDPVFPCLISFICSTQMRVRRIHGMQLALIETFGRRVSLNGTTVRSYPTPGALAEASEAELRDLGLGYRAPYVRETAAMVADGDDPSSACELSYEPAREELTRFQGVGEKVADCVLLFSLGFLEAVPLDTWIRSAIEERYPDCEKDGYAATSRAIRRRLGGPHAGYAQTYLFHYLRTRNATSTGTGG